MFDIGFLELLVIGIIALIVLGPERLPRAARTVGVWVGKAKRSFNSIKQEIDLELQAQDIQKKVQQKKSQLDEHIQLNSLKETLLETQADVNNLASDITSSASLKPDPVQNKITNHE